MSKAVYSGVGNVARKVNKIYVGVNGVARKVTKGYIGVNGVARLFYESYIYPFVSFSGEYYVDPITHNGVEYDLYTLHTSGTLVLAGDVSCWLCGGGAGGAGASSSDSMAGGGGGGGYVSDGTLGNGSHTVVIGAGGAGGTTSHPYTASNGGQTKAGLLSADGGKAPDSKYNNLYGGDGGSGGGGGADVVYNGTSVADGGVGAGVSTYPFGIEKLGPHCAGGGGGGVLRSDGKFATGGQGGSNGGNGGSGMNYSASASVPSDVGSGGYYGGGRGGMYYHDYYATHQTPQDAQYYGAGGGGGAYDEYHTVKQAQNGGTGYQGVVYLLIEAHTSTPPVYVFEITKQPQDVTCAAGETAYFTVEAVGEGLTYNWQIRKPSDTEWSGSTMTSTKTATLEVPATVERSGYKYRCVITDTNGEQIISNTATLTVSASNFYIAKQPQNITCTEGETAYFTVEVVGEGIGYQWQLDKGNGAGWATTTMTGNKTATLEIPAAMSRNGYKYRCLISSSVNGKSLISDAATLTVVSTIVITSQPQSVTTSANETTQFTIKAVGDGLTYAWQYMDRGGDWVMFDGNQLSNSTWLTDTLIITPVKAANGMNIRCIVSDVNDNALTSDVVILTVV